MGQESFLGQAIQSHVRGNPEFAVHWSCIPAGCQHGAQGRKREICEGDVSFHETILEEGGGLPGHRPY